jgi:hypothetical protein
LSTTAMRFISSYAPLLSHSEGASDGAVKGASRDRNKERRVNMAELATETGEEGGKYTN